MTTFENKIRILHEYSMWYKDVEDHWLFNFYMDEAMMLAACMHQGLCVLTDEGKELFEDSWQLFLKTLEIEDKGFERLQDILDLVEK